METGMKTRNKSGAQVVNWMMFFSLVIVFVTGIVIHVAPTTPGKILHVIFGFVLVITACVHMVQHRKRGGNNVS